MKFKSRTVLTSPNLKTRKIPVILGMGAQTILDLSRRLPGAFGGESLQRCDGTVWSISMQEIPWEAHWCIASTSLCHRRHGLPGLGF